MFACITGSRSLHSQISRWIEAKKVHIFLDGSSLTSIM